VANKEHVDVVLRGAEAIAAWRAANPDVRLDLRGAPLRRANLIRANLSGADLKGADLEWADVRWADLIGADLSDATLARADFHKADMAGALLSRAQLAHANFEDASLRGADVSGASLYHTRLVNTDLAGAHGLTSSQHLGPSVLDAETIMKSGFLPTEFMQGCGANSATISAAQSYDFRALPALVDSYGDYFSCFISYASQDEAFAQRLHDDLQVAGVRCWYAPKSMRIGDDILERIRTAIRTHEKLLLAPNGFSDPKR
jgi:uncharacterized protein YjbI with pentapeptide repeats